MEETISLPEEPVIDNITKEIIEEIKEHISTDAEDNFELLCKTIRKRIRENWDAVLGVTGEEGVGKTTFNIQAGKRIDEKFDFAKNILYSPDKQAIKKAIVELHRYAFVDVDEAIKILYKLQWYTDIQIFLNIIYALCRRENKVSALAMPRFKDFNEYFRNHRIKLWIHILDRGMAVVFTKHWSPFIDDPWLMKENQRSIDKAMRRYESLAVPLEEQLRILRKSPNYLMEIAFPPLTEAEELQFEELRKASGVYEEEYSVTKWEKIWRERFNSIINYMIENKILTYNQIAEITQFDSGSLRGFISDMRQKKP